MFESILDDTIKNAKQFEKKFSLLFFDVHGIKKINDALGHEIGDKFLVYAASVFRDCCGEDDIAARFEGNIFIMLVNHDNQTSRILDTINKVIGVFNNSHLIDDEKIYCKISIGVANYPESGTSRLSLLIHADQALYKAKENYYTSYAFYSDKIGEEVDRFSRIESNLRQAIKSDEIYLCYQPQISLKDNKIIGLEALCRWKSEALGEISPIDFIPIAESVQLINQLTKKICEQAFRQCSEWVLEHPALFDNTEISINLSAVSLSDTDFMESILTMYADYNLEPKNICFEVTETAIMSNKEAAYHALKKISDMGFNIAIDDFGTGHSSLAYLKSLPATILKVDSSFVLDIHRDNNDLMIVSAIINLAKSLGLYVIAEGMENKEQLEILRNLEADAIQGYYFSKPILAKDVVSFFSKWGKL
jgi:diguanylate cyclase (GGDEF)-like protein